MKQRLHHRVAALVLTCTTTAAAFAQHPDHGDVGSSVDVPKQTADQARTMDIEIRAGEFGVPYATMERAIAFQERFTDYAAELIARYPDGISRIWLDPAPAIAGHVEFVGSVPVAFAPEGVELLADGRITIAEHHRRAELASEAMRSAGYTNFLTYFDAKTAQTRIEMKIPAGDAAPDRDAIFDIVQERIWNDLDLFGDALVLAPADLALDVIRGAGEIFEYDHSRGGNWLRDDGNRECTSGWSVTGPSGDGIITAAHCVGLNQFEENASLVYSMTWRSQERGNGDVEYHTTSHIELAEFWASSSTLRDVNSTRWLFLMLPGTSVCRYGRSSNFRACSHDIEATGVTVTFTDGVTVSNLVEANGDTAIGGDSGGGWSWSTEAFGVHSGSNDINSWFTATDTAEAELGVDVMTQ